MGQTVLGCKGSVPGEGFDKGWLVPTMVGCSVSCVSLEMMAKQGVCVWVCVGGDDKFERKSERKTAAGPRQIHPWVG